MTLPGTGDDDGGTGLPGGGPLGGGGLPGGG